MKLKIIMYLLLGGVAWSGAWSSEIEAGAG